MSDHVIAEAKYLRLITRNGWEIVQRCNVSGVVVIAAKTKDDNMILIKQYREAVQTSVIELPAGVAGDQGNESLEEAARRELLEETGYQAEHMRLLFTGVTSPGLCDELLSFFVTDSAVRVGPGGGDITENILVYAVPIDQVEKCLNEQMRAGCLIDPKIFIGLYFLRKKQ